MSEMFDTNKEFFMAIRQALLMAVDAIERGLRINPTTAEIRRSIKEKP